MDASTPPADTADAVQGDEGSDPAPAAVAALTAPSLLDMIRRPIDAGAGRAAAWETEARRVAIDLRDWWHAQDRLRTWVPRILFGVIILYYFVAMQRLVWMRHANYGTFDYDLGIYDQAVWLMSRGRGFITVRGMQVFGHHANVGFYLFVPFYWLGAGAQFLNFVNTLAITITAVPLYLIGRHHLRSDWIGCGIGVAYLFHFVPQWLIQETFHPESLAMPFLAGAFYFATVGKWKPYWWCVVFSLIWKEDASLAVIGLGVLMWFMFGQRRRAVYTAMAGAGWFLMATKIMLPLGSPAGAVFDTYFGPMGPTASDVVRNSITNPRLLGRTLSDHKAEQGAWEILRGHGWVALGAPHVLIMGLPQHLINYISIQGFTWNPKSHYFTMPYVAASLAAARSVSTRTRPFMSALLVLAMLGSVGATWQQGIGPWTHASEQGYWPLERASRFDAVEEAMAQIPDDAAVAARYYIVPHLTHRPEIYTFPNPWRPTNYGPGGMGRRNPDRIDYILMTTENLSPEDRAVLDSVVDSGEFDEVLRSGPTDDEVVLLRRVAS